MQNIKKTVKMRMNIIIRVIIRNLLKVLWIFPVKKDRFMFQSHDSAENYNCNPRYISDYFRKKYPGQFELIWSFKTPRRYRNVKGIKPVKKYSAKWFFYMITAKVVVYNATPVTFIPKRKSQMVIETWHGGGAYKRTGYASKKDKLDIWRTKQLANYVDIFLSSSEKFTDVHIKQSYHFEGEILNSGMPRNDCLVNEKQRSYYNGKIRGKYGIEGKIILYAPTFRGYLMSSGKIDTELPYSEIMEAFRKRFNEPVYILRRFHHHDKNEYEDIEGVIDVSDYPEMQELLCAADVLITDYSSSIWDFSLTERPCLLFVPDIEEYETGDRGFYTDPEEWAGILCKTKEELLEAAEGLDIDKCKEKAVMHRNNLGSYDKGTATVQVAERMIRFMRGSKADR